MRKRNNTEKKRERERCGLARQEDLCWNWHGPAAVGAGEELLVLGPEPEPGQVQL